MKEQENSFSFEDEMDLADEEIRSEYQDVIEDSVSALDKLKRRAEEEKQQMVEKAEKYSDLEQLARNLYLAGYTNTDWTADTVRDVVEKGMSAGMSAADNLIATAFDRLQGSLTHQQLSELNSALSELDRMLRTINPDIAEGLFDSLKATLENAEYDKIAAAFEASFNKAALEANEGEGSALTVALVGAGFLVDLLGEVTITSSLINPLLQEAGLKVIDIAGDKLLSASAIGEILQAAFNAQISYTEHAPLAAELALSILAERVGPEIWADAVSAAVIAASMLDCTLMGSLPEALLNFSGLFLSSGTPLNVDAGVSDGGIVVYCGNLALIFYPDARNPAHTAFSMRSVSSLSIGAKKTASSLASAAGKRLSENTINKAGQLINTATKLFNRKQLVDWMNSQPVSETSAINTFLRSKGADVFDVLTQPAGKQLLLAVSEAKEALATQATNQVEQLISRFLNPPAKAEVQSPNPGQPNLSTSDGPSPAVSAPFVPAAATESEALEMGKKVLPGLESSAAILREWGSRRRR